MKHVVACLIGWLAVSTSLAQDDFTSLPWIVNAVQNHSIGDAPGIPIKFPGGLTKNGNELRVHYGVSGTDFPQLWTFLSNGFWRQVARESAFFTSTGCFDTFLRSTMFRIDR